MACLKEAILALAGPIPTRDRSLAANRSVATVPPQACKSNSHIPLRRNIMSGVGWRLGTPEILVESANGATTVLQIKAPANQREYIEKIDLSFKGSSVTDAPPLVRILRQTSAGTGGDVLAPVKEISSDSE